MDQLYKRYADPFSFMNGMIQTGRFCEFVIEFAKTIHDEKEEQYNWEFWLHKVWEGTYQDFKKELEINREHQNMSERTIETTVQHSMQILNNFNPEQQGGE